MNQPVRTLRRGFRTSPGAGGRGGFTLLEMLVVVIIIGLLAALVWPRLSENLGTSKIKTTMAQISSLDSAVEQFYAEVGRYPTQEEGLAALLKAPAGVDADKWRGPYLRKNELPKDGWNRPFEYAFDEQGRFLIRSLGADGRAGGEGENADLDNRNS